MEKKTNNLIKDGDELEEEFNRLVKSKRSNKSEKELEEERNQERKKQRVHFDGKYRNDEEEQCINIIIGY